MALYLTGNTSNITIDSTSGITFPNSTLQAVAAQTGPSFSATSNANQTITSNTFTLVSLQTKNWDTATAFNNTGSTATLNGISTPAYAFAPPVAGYYQLNFSIDSGGSTSPTRAIASVYKNGSAYRYGGNLTVTTAFGNGGSSFVYLNGTSDYIQMYAYITASTAIVGNVAAQTYFEAVLARVA